VFTNGFLKVSIQFGAFHFTRQQIESYNATSHERSDRSLTSAQVYLAGGLAGMANSVVSTPVEHIRIRLQTQPHGARRLYSGPRDCAQAIYRQAGFAGLYKGQVSTLLREIHGYGVWFASYEALIALSMTWSRQKREELNGWKIALCGGLAGDALWLACYPLDVIKTKIQSDGFGQQRVYPSIRSVVKDTWRLNKIRGFYHGLGPTLVRTMITSGGTFLT
jgi:solute carrier family 25 carnitine/acylcarnitine transporter 20/29